MCVCVCVGACVRACVRVCVIVHMTEKHDAARHVIGTAATTYRPAICKCRTVAAKKRRREEVIFRVGAGRGKW